MKLLLTGFENFLDHPYNPTERIISNIKKKSFNPHLITTSILPVSFEQARKKTKLLLTEEHYDFHFALGLAASRKWITPEVVAVNLTHNPGRPDNEGMESYLTPLKQNAPEALMSTLPLKEIESHLNRQGYHSELSFTAGTYVCNAVMYEALHYISEKNLSTRSGFIHIPPDKNFSVDSFSNPSLEELTQAVEIIITTCLN